MTTPLLTKQIGFMVAGASLQADSGNTCLTAVLASNEILAGACMLLSRVMDDSDVASELFAIKALVLQAHALLSSTEGALRIAEELAPENPAYPDRRGRASQ
ncbi:MAG: hypothetical protein DI560_07815 [Pseudomonas putida]|nr:MAG: hypothetical protein DI560_07815 [Pseudomonas putida]